MVVIFSVNTSEKNTIGKTLIRPKNFDCELLAQCDTINPSFRFECDTYPDYNYCYIPEFNRCYFVDSVSHFADNLWIVSLNVDVLESFKSSLVNQLVILSDTQVTGATNYISGDQWVTNVKTNTEIIPFPAGLLESGEYILITAGG